MSDPKRWSSAGSEVDPVLRSLVRYAQSRAPSAGEVERVVLAVERAARERPRGAGGRRLGRTFVWLAAAACGGLAWAGVAGSRGWLTAREVGPRAVHERGPSHERAAPNVPLEPPPSAALPGAVPAAPSAAPSAADRSSLAAPSARAAVAGAVKRAAKNEPESSVGGSAAPVVAATSADERTRLTEARRLLTTAPASALALTAASARENPQSPFAEEREAIAIEALARLGRRAEAERRFAAFERAYPASPYRRRLRARLE